MLLLTLACGAPDPATLVDELRVLVVQSEPADIRLSDFSSFSEMPPQLPSTPDQITIPTEQETTEPEDPKLNIVIADPLQEGVEVAVWICTNLGDGCLEKDIYQDNPADWIQYYQPQEPELSIPLPLNPLWAGFIGQPTESNEYFLASLVWVLACAPNTCDPVTKLGTGQVDLDAFSDPFSLIEQVPLQQSSLAFRSLYLSSSTTSERLQNPTITPLFDELSLTPGNSLSLEFEVEMTQRSDEAIIYGYTTLGGFGTNDLVNNGLSFFQGTTSLQWFTTEADEGEAQLFSIVDDGLGGIGYWIDEGFVGPANQ